ncbi:hypothetical protein A2U01_0021894, partial [Trifolium medium]|nr:hypothetical protein [Trifolium medium]
MVGSYLDGFDFANAQAKVIYTGVDHQLLEHTDPFKVIRDGKLVDQECPASAVSPKAHSSGELWLPLHSRKALCFKFSLAVMSSFTLVVSDAASAFGPFDLRSIDSLVESMKALLKEDLDDLFLVPWMIYDFHEITRNLEKFCESLTP